jgi:hypothetical protein
MHHKDKVVSDSDDQPYILISKKVNGVRINFFDFFFLCYYYFDKKNYSAERNTSKHVA